MVYIKKQYNVEYSIAGLTDWLHRQGFTYKKPKGLPAKADTERQKAFIDYYKKLEESLPPTQGLVFIDSAHPTQATKLSYGWIKKGVSKAVKTSASRTRVNITGAVDIQTKQVYARCYDSINASSMISFLNDLQRQACYSAKEKIHVILDGAGYHRSKELAEWIAKNPRYQLHFLPPYSPNLNPIERLWKIMNEHMRNNRYFTTAKEFRDAISYFFEHKILELHEVLQKRITSNFQVLQI
ncbi:MAG: IS630 family transposase [Bacteroidota bacterium]